MVSLFQSYFTLNTDTYSPHPVHIEMEEFSDVQFKQRAIIAFLTVGKVPPIEIQTYASSLQQSVCLCEYSRTLGNAVQRWIIEASRFE
jgi:hypothetical protein